jgi:hypothetical protein
LGVLGILLALVITCFLAKAGTSIQKEAAKARRGLPSGGAFSTGLARVALLIAFSGFAKCDFSPDWTIQPRHDVMEWGNCSQLMVSLSYPNFTAAMAQRINGGCGRMTFCNRDETQDYYDAGKYGYRMDGVDGAQCVSPGPILHFESGYTYGLGKSRPSFLFMF